MRGRAADAPFVGLQMNWRCKDFLFGWQQSTFQPSTSNAH
jgi:hypothetical protein